MCICIIILYIHHYKFSSIIAILSVNRGRNATQSLEFYSYSYKRIFLLLKVEKKRIFTTSNIELEKDKFKSGNGFL